MNVIALFYIQNGYILVLYKDGTEKIITELYPKDLSDSGEYDFVCYEEGISIVSCLSRVWKDLTREIDIDGFQIVGHKIDKNSRNGSRICVNFYRKRWVKLFFV